MLVRFVAALLLAASMIACRADVDVTLHIGSSGAGTFRVVFAFDKEFLTVVEASEEGKSSLAQLRSLGSGTAASGWAIRQSAPDGGLRLEIQRAFEDPKALEEALSDVASENQGPLSFLAVFRDVRISRESGFFSNQSRLSGNVDLTPERLAPGVEIDPDVRAAFEQAGREAFRFAVTAEFAGRVSRFEGDPEKVSGGTVVWTANLGRTLRFSADASALRAQAVVPAGALGLAALGAAVAMVLRVRRRRAAPVPGWEPVPNVHADE